MSHKPVKIIDVLEERENGKSVFTAIFEDITPARYSVKLHKASAASINQLVSLKGKNAMVGLNPYLMNGNAGFSFKDEPIFELPSQAGTVKNLSEPVNPTKTNSPI